MLNPMVVLLLVFIYLCFLRTFHTLLQGFPGGSNCKESVCKPRDLGWKDPLEKDMATHFSILAWEMSWSEEPVGLQSMGSQTVRLSMHAVISANMLLIVISDY